MLNFGWAYAQRKCCVKFGWASEWTDLHVGFKVTEEKGGLLDKTLWYAALLYLTCFPTWEGRYRDKERGGLSITLSRGLTASRRWGLSTRRDERRENKIERLGKAHYAARRVVFALSLTTLTSKQLFINSVMHVSLGTSLLFVVEPVSHESTMSLYGHIKNFKSFNNKNKIQTNKQKRTNFLFAQTIRLLRKQKKSKKTTQISCNLLQQSGSVLETLHQPLSNFCE